MDPFAPRVRPALSLRRSVPAAPSPSDPSEPPEPVLLPVDPRALRETRARSSRSSAGLQLFFFVTPRCPGARGTTSTAAVAATGIDPSAAARAPG